MHSDHFSQANRNLKVLSLLNDSDNKYWEWQITTLFYSALHLINGHIKNTLGHVFHTHSDVANIIHHTNDNPASLPRLINKDYAKLQMLSRKARYLYDMESENRDQISKTGQADFETAVICYESVANQMKSIYGPELIQSININCPKAGWNNRNLPL